MMEEGSTCPSCSADVPSDAGDSCPSCGNPLSTGHTDTDKEENEDEE